MNAELIIKNKRKISMPWNIIVANYDKNYSSNNLSNSYKPARKKW